MDYVWLLKFLSLSIFPVLAIGVVFYLLKIKKNALLYFYVWDRKIAFDTISKEIRYKSRAFTPSVRTFWDIKDLYSEKQIDWTSEVLDDNYELYFMYRDVSFESGDVDLFRKNNIRYDITILVPKLFWKEYNKTYWHFHPSNKSWSKYQEVYNVLSWEAIYLQQKEDEVFYTKASAPKSVNMDEWFWHVTINPSKDNFLVMSNLVDDSFDSIYDDYKTKKWANYLYKTTWFEKNKNYDNSLEIKESSKYFESENIYDDFLKNPEKFNFLH